MATLRLITYNMLDAPGDRLDTLTAVVQRLRPDVLACQEITDIQGFLRLSAALGMPGAIAQANGPEVMEADRGQNLSKHKREHVGLLSRYPIDAFCAHIGDPRILFRSVLEARLEIPDLGSVRAFAVHLRAFPGPAGAHFKMREAEVVSAILRQHADSPYRFILGDFNAWMRGEGELGNMDEHYPQDHIAAIRGEVTDCIRNSGVEDVWRLQGTDPQQIPSTVLGLGRRSSVDHIMVSPALGRYLQRVFVPDDDLLRTASDHLPVVADFEWP